MDDQISKNAKDRKQDEALDFSQRRARSRLMKKIKTKLKLGRAKAARKTASIDILKKRTLKQVRNVLFLKFSKGKTRDEIPAARRKEIEARIDKIPKERLKNLAMKLLPKVRKQEMERKRKKAESGAK
jgi:hypothetical protein